MAFWLFKSEPDAYSWDRLRQDGVTDWTGVRNHQANNNMKAMRRGDRGFFYHSQEGREIMGVVEVVAEHRPDPTDATGRFGMVSLKPIVPLTAPVTLKQMKADRVLSEMVLVRHSRLSVSPVSDAEWRHICRLGGVEALVVQSEFPA